MCPPSRPSGAGPKDAHAETTEELGKSPTPAKTADLSTKTKRLYTRKEVAESDDWLFIIENQVYKVPEVWATNSHPGGEILLRDARGADITLPFLNNHSAVATPVLKRFHVGHVDEELSAMETEFADLIKSVRDDPTWFQARPDFFLGLLVRYSAILAFSIYFALYGESYWTRVVLSAVLMGSFFQQTAFLGHDLGHNGMTHSRFWDEMIGICVGNCIGGISVGWWKATHNVHHLVTNSVEYDCDIQHMPVFAVTPKFFHNVFSHYHFKTFQFDRLTQFLLSYQHILYYPILAVARFNLYLQSLILVFSSPKTYRRWGGNRQFLEIATLGVFWSWFVMLLAQLPSGAERIAFLFISHAVAGILHVQITISHFPMPVQDGNPLTEEFRKREKMNWIQVQLSGSLDVDCPPWMDWFHGGLQFQAVHHLVTRIPRHNLRKLRDERILPFCEKHGLEYKMAGFVECNVMVIRTLAETAGQVHPFLEHVWNASG